MPDHFHLVVETADARAEHARVVRTLAGLSRTFGHAGMWEAAPEPETIADAKHLGRVVRYVHLNPCRARLADDPLSWPWCTHRGVLGAEIDPWVTSARLATVLRRDQAGFREWFHAYVSGDPSVNPEGTPLPRAARSTPVPVLALQDIVRAALSATPWSARALRRHVTVRLAHEQGWGSAPQLRDALGISARSHFRYRATPTDLAAARLCLGDARLCFATGRELGASAATLVSGRSA